MLGKVRECGAVDWFLNWLLHQVRSGCSARADSQLAVRASVIDCAEAALYLLEDTMGHRSHGKLCLLFVVVLLAAIFKG